jgi:glycyl-tRNA synthetase beta chain
MRSHQKYFSVLGKDGALAPRFIAVSNMETADKGAAIIAGNQRVLRARLSDAAFFWDTDRKTRLETRVPTLAGRLFYQGLGSMADKSTRIRALAVDIAKAIGADQALADRAALLAKADLSSEMVGEFPELQGIMGRYYAVHDGENPVVAQAIADHYSPAGPSDATPTHPVSVAVALADRLDTLAGFFGIDEKPTGSKDPFALRRAALGVIRLIAENGLRFPLADLFARAAGLYGFDTAKLPDELMAFFADRLKVSLRDKGERFDLVNAVFNLGGPGNGGEDDLVRLLMRVRALSDFVVSDDGVNLLAAYRRAVNIVRIEEKKDGAAITAAVDAAILTAPEEHALFHALSGVRTDVGVALDAEDFTAAMGALARLRKPVDAFFTAVTVNADDKALRANRLSLLSEIGRVMGLVADFSAIEG